MAEIPLTDALSSVLGAAVPSAARQQLLAAVTRPAEHTPVVVELAPRRQARVSPAPERPSAA